jgi:hypothetical protein
MVSAQAGSKIHKMPLGVSGGGGLSCCNFLFLSPSLDDIQSGTKGVTLSYSLQHSQIYDDGDSSAPTEFFSSGLDKFLSLTLQVVDAIFQRFLFHAPDR